MIRPTPAPENLPSYPFTTRSTSSQNPLISSSVSFPSGMTKTLYPAAVSFLTAKGSAFLVSSTIIFSFLNNMSATYPTRREADLRNLRPRASRSETTPSSLRKSTTSWEDGGTRCRIILSPAPVPRALKTPGRPTLGRFLRAWRTVGASRGRSLVLRLKAGEIVKQSPYPYIRRGTMPNLSLVTFK